MPPPDPLVIPWSGRQVRIRHDDPALTLYSSRAAVLRSAMQIASDVDGLRLALASCLGERCRVKVADDGSGVGLWRLAGGGR